MFVNGQGKPERKRREREKMNKKEILKLAKGFRGRAKNCIRIARERVEKALQYSYRDRRNKKRDMRSLWIQRINAGTRQHGVSFPFLGLLLLRANTPSCSLPVCEVMSLYEILCPHEICMLEIVEFDLPFSES